MYLRCWLLVVNCRPLLPAVDCCRLSLSVVSPFFIFSLSHADPLADWLNLGLSSLSASTPDGDGGEGWHLKESASEGGQLR